MFEGLRRDPQVKLHPVLAHGPLIYDEVQRRILEQRYLQYYKISKDFQIPMLTFTNTWRTNKPRLQETKFKNENINFDCVTFLKKLASPFSKVVVGGLMGCVGDAYKAKEALTAVEAEEVHDFQAKSLTEAGVDFLYGSTLPALSEATGIARAMGKYGLPYVLSFVIRPNGNLLDGSPLDKAIATIDSSTVNKPLFYMVNCVHPSIFQKAMTQLRFKKNKALNRVLGFKANTCALSPEELDGAVELHSEDPEVFAKELLAIYREYNLKVISGCCGTDDRHIRALAAGLTSKSPQSAGTILNRSF